MSFRCASVMSCLILFTQGIDFIRTMHELPAISFFCKTFEKDLNLKHFNIEVYCLQILFPTHLTHSRILHALIITLHTKCHEHSTRNTLRAQPNAAFITFPHRTLRMALWIQTKIHLFRNFT